MKIFNKYTYLLLGIVVIATVVVLTLVPDLETEEFDQNVIDNIIEGVTTTTIFVPEEEEIQDVQEILTEEEGFEIPEDEVSKIEKILINNKFEEEISEFDAYLLIGSDERSEKIALTRGKITGKRADVIILGLVNRSTNNLSLLSFPRDLLIKNNCTGELERINASYSKNDCGGRAENLAASIYSISGIRVTHFASFDFEGFEKIVDSVDGIEICVDKTQREGFSFELQKGCQTVNGLTTLNWVVSRSTEELVGEKKLDDKGNDISQWKIMTGVSDLARIERQQYVVTQLVSELSNFSSLGELNSFISALESSFIIDENLSINKAVEILWTFRNVELDKVNKMTTPVDFVTLNDGRQVLVLSKPIKSFLIEKSVLDS